MCPWTGAFLGVSSSWSWPVPGCVAWEDSRSETKVKVEGVEEIHKA